MKKTLCFVAFGLALCATPFLTKAQEKKSQEDKVKKNAVKMNLFPLAAKTYAFEYERVLIGKLTAVGMFSYRAESNLPFVSSWSSLIDDKDAKDILGNTTQGATSFAVEARFYTGKKGAMRGFYLAPYIKQATYSLKVPLPVDVDPGDPAFAPIKEVMANGNLKTFTAGLGFGTQFSIGKSVTLDWKFFAPGYGSSNGTLTGKAKGPNGEDRKLTPNEQAEIREQLDELGEIPLVKIESDVNADGVKAKIRGPWAGIRTGLSIGYKF